MIDVQDILNEQLVPLLDSKKLFPIAPDTSTLWRWCLRGTRRAKLETVLCGGRRFTSREAIQRFIRASSGLPVQTQAPTARRKRELAIAEAKAVKQGI